MPPREAKVVRFLERQPHRATTFSSLSRYFNGWSFASVKAYIRSRPDLYMIISKTVVLITPTSTQTGPPPSANGSATAAAQPPGGPRLSSANGGSSSAHGFFCGLCRANFETRAKLDFHKGTAKHRIKLVSSQLQQQGAWSANSGGVEVPELPEVELAEGQEAVQTLNIWNRSQTTVILVSFSLIKRSPSVFAHDAMGRAAPGVELHLTPGSCTPTTIRITPQAPGLIRDVLILEFEGFAIMRKVSASCEPDVGPGMPSIAPTAPYEPKPRPKLDRSRDQTAIPGEKPDRLTDKWMNPPKQHSIPSWLEDALLNGRLEKVEKLLNVPVRDCQSYAQKMQLLLWIEELQHEVDILTYNMTGVPLERRSGGLVGLKVPGLAENRPSVMKGDALYVTPPGAQREWQGYVHRVERDEVQLKFNSDFTRSQLIEASRYDVRFSIKRSTFVFMQNAIDRARDPRILHPCTLLGKAGLDLLPKSSGFLSGLMQSFAGRAGLRSGLSGRGQALSLLDDGQEPTWSPSIHPLNEEQKSAVRAILRAEHAPMPYLIFGPPGTGKTNTTAEAAVQVFRRDPSARILITAPSNWAADLLGVRMMDKHGPLGAAMMRINAYSRNEKDLDLRLSKCSNWDDGANSFTMPPCTKVMQKRVIVVTCLMAAKLYALGVPQGHFTHIFLDEAGHAEEPLSLSAIAGLLSADDSARFVMAGDPCQLGPVVLSKLAKQYGLDVSAMERLIHMEPYVYDDLTQRYDSRYITKLVKNYRSHPKILELPNKLFYENELQACADYEVTHGLLGFKGLPNSQFPIIFHSVVGKDCREGNSPSWFNEMEVKLVVKYVDSVLGMKSNRPTPNQTGVISPFRKQVEKLRVMLGHKYSKELKIGSTEEFQGQEKRVIIVSTVRSSDEHLEFDRRHRLGFLSNPKRFNVAMTRAQGLLIIIGNPAVLAHDPNWAEMLTFIAANNGATGSPLPPHIEEAAAKLRADGATSSSPGFGVNSNGRTGSAAANMNGAGAFGPSQAHSAADEEAALSEALSKLQLVTRPAADSGTTADSCVADSVPMISGLQVEGGEMPRWE